MVLADASRVQGLLAALSLNGLGVAAADGERVLGFMVPLACVLSVSYTHLRAHET